MCVLLLNRFVDFCDILYGAGDAEGVLVSILLDPVASNFPKRRVFKFLLFANFDLICGLG
jgi:hypothetical protein